ncbi:bifunctional 4-hydroxy-2-oxoglutarate aldolase/2-dehydro-3-deoxy-phosphogluconate aldolase [Arthrobacter sp. 24S4-2]|uniref:bifunctional 4-hydroxy-2-oxoglutarate aldolase/2-dehydro-3-deoxy-phosphogluconate aldolase n=1 Tax=Arthrobacter sp. 24S4-2 TaxID=2575374 RepID=UPI0020C80322|nr:bifunctional 4-hydroxy-2-oxoglutarate aldolase/2-dehydro-3-deoxy-phosphogluconate aldolase [Arthrobacter sp. 24S4-2]
MLPIVVVDNAEHAEALGTALLDGGINQVEVTLRTEAAVEVIRRLAAIPELTVGAGTVLSATDVDRVTDAGAKFLISPGWDEKVHQSALDHGVPWFPGVATATELMTARSAGIKTVKLFPAAQLGGTAFIDALTAAFPGTTFLPSGGINIAEVPEYLRRPSVLAVGGSWIAGRSLIASGSFIEIEDSCRNAMRTLQ